MKCIFLFLLLIFSCREVSTEIHDTFFLTTQKGKIIIHSNPVGAKIFLSDIDINKITPDSILNLEAGSYKITLSKEKYLDTTFTIVSEDGKYYLITLKKPLIWKR